MPDRFAILAFLVFGVGLSALASAQRPAESARPRSGEGDRRETRELLRQLPEAQRQQVMRALKKIWEDEDVRAAREQLHGATENYKRTIQAAVSEADPELAENVRPLLKRLLREGGPEGARERRWGPRGGERGSGDDQARFFRMLGLSRDRIETLVPEARERIVALHQEVMNDPRVQAASVAARAAREADVQPGVEGEGQKSDHWLQAMKAWREVMLTVAREKEPRLDEWIGKKKEAVADEHTPSQE